MEYTGIVKNASLRDSQNGYRFLECYDDVNNMSATTLWGIMPDVKIGKKLTFSGNYVNTQNYGKLFKFDSYAETQEKSEYTGFIKNIVFKNDENGYHILRCTEKPNGGKITTVCGVIPDVKKGQKFLFTGEYVEHPKYGRQFKFDAFEEKIDSSETGIAKYLGSGIIRGIGPKIAQAIVDVFGNKTMDVLNNNPEELANVPGIGKKKYKSIIKGWKEHQEIANIMVFLRECGVSQSLAGKIYRKYQNNAVSILKKNPYQLIKDIDGVGFKTADDIALSPVIGYTKDDPRRMKAAVVYLMECETNMGHCYATMDDIVSCAVKMFGMDADAIREAVNSAVKSKDLIIEGNLYWLPKLYNAEKHTAEYLTKIMNTPGIPINGSIDNSVISNSRIDYAETQLEAIQAVADHKVFVLTGGPGTGKSTVSKALLDVFKEAGLNCLLAAPTGRAAKRLSETTGREAKTIHRLLEFKPNSDMLSLSENDEGTANFRFQRNLLNPLECDAVLIDEASMIDIELMNHLLEAIPNQARVIFVGDVDQLPSVGAGNVLRDIIESGSVHVVKLSVIFRQKEGSKIIDYADRVNKGIRIYPEKDKTGDLAFYDDADPESIVEKVIGLINKYRSEGLSLDNIQVLYPQKKTSIIGTIDMNERLQFEYNPNGERVEGTGFRIGDKVMQMKNNYDKDVFNGDVGHVSGFDSVNRKFTVNFDGNEVVYDVIDHDELSLAYACTVHKSQGSEYSHVILLFTKVMPMLSCRNLLYTGMTRAKKHLDLIGRVYDINRAVDNNHVAPRRTMLKQRLNKSL